MNNMLLTIALHELRASVMRASFVWMTLGMPVLVGFYVLTVSWIGSSSASEVQRVTRPVEALSVVDEGGLLGDAPGFQRFDTVDDADEALDRGSIAAFVVLPADYLERGALSLYTENFAWWSPPQPNQVADRIGEQLLRARGVDEATLERTGQRPTVDRFERGDDGSFVEVDLLLETAGFAVPLATTFGLVFALAMNASLLLASVVEDKENKMMDVLLSSARADDLLFGKVLGIVGAGLLQLTVWALMASPLAGAALFVADPAELLSVVSVPRLLMSLAFGVVSFLFYGVMLVGLGSFGSSFRDSQQLAAIVIMMPMVPVIAGPMFLFQPNGVGARFLSFFPPTAAPAMMLRVAIVDIAWWEIAASLAVLLASILVAVRLAARLFRAGTLLYGKRPSLTLLWRALTEPM